MICQAKLEPGQPDRNTHTCELEADHAGPHRCPVCHSTWVFVTECRA